MADEICTMPGDSVGLWAAWVKCVLTQGTTSPLLYRNFIDAAYSGFIQTQKSQVENVPITSAQVLERARSVWQEQQFQQAGGEVVDTLAEYRATTQVVGKTVNLLSEYRAGDLGIALMGWVDAINAPTLRDAQASAGGAFTDNFLTSRSDEVYDSRAALLGRFIDTAQPV